MSAPDESSSPISSTSTDFDGMVAPDSNGTLPDADNDIAMLEPDFIPSSEHPSKWSMSKLGDLSEYLSSDGKEEDGRQWEHYFTCRRMIKDMEDGSARQRRYIDSKHELQRSRRLWHKHLRYYQTLSKKYAKTKEILLERLRGSNDVLLKKEVDIEIMDHTLKDKQKTLEEYEHELESRGRRIADLEEATKEWQRITADLQRQNDFLQDELAAWNGCMETIELVVKKWCKVQHGPPRLTLSFVNILVGISLCIIKDCFHLALTCQHRNTPTKQQQRNINALASCSGLFVFNVFPQEIDFFVYLCGMCGRAPQFYKHVGIETQIRHGQWIMSQTLR